VLKEETMPITVLDPTPGVVTRAARMARPLAGLTGARVALLDNGKVNVGRFLDHVEELLRAGHGVTDVVRRRKSNMSAPVPLAMLAELTACDAVVTAVGD
jgi:hypothetical protein